ncbi:MAG TPA: type II CAAX endopeptidase family protein [Acidobacteriota bacterium]|nr:type II CAAX endopeptidase family protein [Acidobacteriota bacterium]
MSGEDALLRPVWRSVFRNSLVLNCVLFVLFVVLRVYGLVGPVPAPFVLLAGFLVMSFAPFVFFSRTGRREMGLETGWNGAYALYALLLGLVVATLTLALLNVFLAFSFFHFLFAISPERPLFGEVVAFMLLLSLAKAVGEEFFFRGMLHTSIRESRGKLTATVLNALAFGVLYVPNSELSTVRLPLVLWWVAIVIGLGLIFTLVREKMKSIWPAFLAHLSYNLTVSAMLLLY